MLDNLSQEQKHVLIYWILFGVIFASLAILISYITISKKSEETFVDTDYGVVTDYNRYYTVKNAIIKYLSYVNSKDSDSIYEVLDTSYINDNSITKDNVLSKVENYNVAISYKSNKMCYKRIAKGITSYEVRGSIISMNTSSYLNDKYYNIILDENNITFTIKPIEESTIISDCHE